VQRAPAVRWRFCQDLRCIRLVWGQDPGGGIAIVVLVVLPPEVCVRCPGLGLLLLDLALSPCWLYLGPVRV
jgi:hypothetical protein